MEIKESDESDVESDMERVIADPNPVDASQAMVRLDLFWSSSVTSWCSDPTCQ